MASKAKSRAKANSRSSSRTTTRKSASMEPTILTLSVDNTLTELFLMNMEIWLRGSGGKVFSPLLLTDKDGRYLLGHRKGRITSIRSLDGPRDLIYRKIRTSILRN